MDHQTIDEQSWVERYHQGRLSPRDEMRFEAHFVDCPRCMEQLELARGFQRGLKTMVAEDAARATAVGWLAFLARRGRRARLGLALVAVLAAGLPYLWLRSARPVPDRSAGAGIAVNTPVFVLSAVRSAAAAPAATVDPARAGDRFALAVDVDDDPSIESYRAAVLGAGGAPLWQGEDLRPNALETLMITFPASFFTAGDYRLEVEGLRADGSAIEIGSFRFRVVAGD